MHMYVDQSRSDDEIACINLINFGSRISDFGKLGDAAIDNPKIGNFIALVRRINDAAIANDRRAHVAIPPQR